MYHSCFVAAYGFIPCGFFSETSFELLCTLAFTTGSCELAGVSAPSDEDEEGVDEPDENHDEIDIALSLYSEVLCSVKSQRACPRYALKQLMRSAASRQPKRHFVLFLTSCLAFPHAFASIGDRSQAYQQCVATCLSDVCASPSGPPLSLPLRLTFWKCPDDCSYQCAHNLTSMAVATDSTFEEKLRTLPGLPPNRIVQFHGKWPFWRVLGIQEPASVLFSLVNMRMHIKHGLAMPSRLPDDLPAPVRKAYSLLPFAGINLWIWSSIFHTRDKPLTEKMDYFSAAFSMMCSLYAAIVRLAGLCPSGPHQRAKVCASTRQGLALALGVIFLCHVSYLTFWSFDYGYNMLFNVSIGLAHNLLWAAWSAYQALQSPGKRAPHYTRPFLVLTLLSSLITLELLDFPPFLRTIDAHSLWHLSTIPVIKLWYDCLVTDAWWLVGRSDEHLERASLSQKRDRLS